jgi:hypothetical protein
MPNSIPIQAFTLTGSKILRELYTDIGISEPIYEPSVSSDDRRIIRTRALWDTGATNSVVTKTLATKMKLKPVGRVLSSHANGTTEVNVYLVNFFLPNSFYIPYVRVTECEDTQSFGAIIGMDIITLGDFSITNVEGKTVFSFRMPSSETIDYKKNLTIPKNYPRLNDLCYCGSGRKYRYCHARGKR